MTMDLATFQALLDAHGADATRWPAPGRAEMQALAARSGEAAAMLAAARRLDGLLVQGLVGEASANLRFRITAGASMATARTPVRTGWFAAPWRLGTAAAAAASIALGMLIGLESSVATIVDSAEAETMDLAALTYGQLDGLEDIQ